MKIIVPMAGRGSRLRPHTLTVPKPLVKIAGKPIVHRLVEDIAAVCDEPIEEVGFIIGDFGDAVEKELIALAEELGAKGTIYHQEEALGTAHAILCAAPSLTGKVVVAFADTLFKADFKMDDAADGVLWVKQIEDPSAFGVVQLNDKNEITAFVEKPKEFVSDLAMIGIYYFKNGEELKLELDYLIDNNIIKGGEYQLPDALRRMTEKGKVFKPGKVDGWYDCGNKKVTVETHKSVLDNLGGKNIIHAEAVSDNTIIIPPVYMGKGAQVKNSIIGPHVSIGDHSMIENCVIKNSILQDEVTAINTVMSSSMVGANAKIKGQPKNLSISDFSEIE